MRKQRKVETTQSGNPTDEQAQGSNGDAMLYQRIRELGSH